MSGWKGLKESRAGDAVREDVPCRKKEGAQMRINGIDHVVLTTASLRRCLDFYGRVLGLECVEEKGRWSVQFGHAKLNIHVRPGEFRPAAASPAPGALDLCLVVEGTLADALAEVEAAGWSIELGIVERNGARGPMRSFYVRDPDGNLIELAGYGAAPRDGRKPSSSDAAVV